MFKNFSARPVSGAFSKVGTLIDSIVVDEREERESENDDFELVDSISVDDEDADVIFDDDEASRYDAFPVVEKVFEVLLELDL